MIGEGGQESLFFTAPECFFCAKRALFWGAAKPHSPSGCFARASRASSIDPSAGWLESICLDGITAKQSRRWCCRCTGTLCTSCRITPQPPTSLTRPLHCNVGPSLLTCSCFHKFRTRAGKGFNTAFTDRDKYHISICPFYIHVPSVHHRINRKCAQKFHLCQQTTFAMTFQMARSSSKCGNRS